MAQTLATMVSVGSPASHRLAIMNCAPPDMMVMLMRSAHRGPMPTLALSTPHARPMGTYESMIGQAAAMTFFKTNPNQLREQKRAGALPRPAPTR